MAAAWVQKLLLALSLVFILAGLGLSIYGAFSPAWQVVDIREFRSQHQASFCATIKIELFSGWGWIAFLWLDGLDRIWLDCIRAESPMIPEENATSVIDLDNAPLQCMYKFENHSQLAIPDFLLIDVDGTLGENEHHQLRAWHIAILVLIVLSEFLAFLALCTGAFMPRFPRIAPVFMIFLVVALLCSGIADGIFLVEASKVDNRFVQGMVGTYEQHIGLAFYLHLSGTLCWGGALILALTYKLVAGPFFCAS